MKNWISYHGTLWGNLILTMKVPLDNEKSVHDYLYPFSAIFFQISVSILYSHIDVLLESCGRTDFSDWIKDS